MKKLKISLEMFEEIVTVETGNSDMLIQNIFNRLIIPVLLGSGYNQDDIDNYLGKNHEKIEV